MSYYFSRTLRMPFTQAVQRVTEALATQGFGVLTQIDVQQTLKKKLDVEFPPYVILGACNPRYAHQALLAEEHIGTMLPCNVIVRQQGADTVEVATVDPVASMQAIENPKLAVVAGQVRALLKAVVDSL
jgi:uncharacterized protein (DUF302 family)